MWQGEAKDFDDAISIYERQLKEKYRDDSGSRIERYEGEQAKRSKYGIWACRLFDNEKDAREAFG